MDEGSGNMGEFNEKELVKMAAEIAAVKAIETVEKERVKSRKHRKDWRLRNTRLLLEHYQEFKQHAEHAFFSIQEAIEAANQDVSNYTEEISVEKDLYVKSIMLSAGRTAALIEDVDKMLNLYALQCHHGTLEKQRRYRIIAKLFLEKERQTVIKVAMSEHVAESTVYRDIENAVKDLSCLIFGIDIFLDTF